MLRVFPALQDDLLRVCRLGEPVLGRSEKFLQVLVQATDGERVLFADDLPARAQHLEAVGARGVRRGGDERARRAVCKFEVGRHVVLRFDVVPFAEMAEGVHLIRHAADPLQQVELVRALVQQHAAAFALPRGPPAARIVIILRAEPVGDDPVHAADLADRPALDEVVHADVQRVGALVVHHGEQAPALFGGGVHLLDLLCVHPRGLFAHDVQALAQRADGQRRVAVMRHGDDDGVHVCPDNFYE